ncbi:MAG: shikimate dehydrogenase [Caulobacter sp.]
MIEISQGVVRAGLIGAGIQQSRSPALHTREGSALGLDYRYDLFDLDLAPEGLGALGRIVYQAERDGYAGLNVTYPAKQAIIPLLSELSQDAADLGAVNTIVFSNGRRVGHNTDCFGFAEGFRRGLPGVALERVVQLGAGGAGSAVAYALLSLGVGQLCLFDPDADRLEGLIARLARRFGSGRVSAGTDLSAAMSRADGLVNATPIGMAKHPGLPLAAHLLSARLWISEVIYVPLETQLVQLATQMGCRVVDGGAMAVFQAAMAMKLFTDVEPDSERMLAHFNEITRNGGVI